MTANIIWLASFPKSGNTWLRLFLACWLHDRPVGINELAEAGFGAGDTRPDLYMKVADKPAEDITPTEVPVLRRKVHEHISQSAFPGRVFVKTHNAVALHEGIPTIPQNLTDCAVYVVRDPRDVAVSFAHHNGQGIDEAIAVMGRPDAIIGHGDTSIGQCLGTWSDHVLSWRTPPFPVCFVRYEDMKSRAFRTFSGIIRFLEDEEPDEDRVRRAILNTSFSRIQKQEEQDGFREQSSMNSKFFRSGKIGDWKKILTIDQVEIIKNNHSSVMKMFGYLD